MFDAIKPGQDIEVTIATEPRRHADRETILRLMRLDPLIKKSLSSAQHYRMSNLYVRSRGRRPWAVRRKSSKSARVEQGATWNMKYYPDIAADFQAVAKFLSFK